MVCSCPFRRRIGGGVIPDHMGPIPASAATGCWCFQHCQGRGQQQLSGKAARGGPPAAAPASCRYGARAPAHTIAPAAGRSRPPTGAAPTPTVRAHSARPPVAAAPTAVASVSQRPEAQALSPPPAAAGPAAAATGLPAPPVYVTDRPAPSAFEPIKHLVCRRSQRLHAAASAAPGPAPRPVKQAARQAPRPPAPALQKRQLPHYQPRQYRLAEDLSLQTAPRQLQRAQPRLTLM